MANLCDGKITLLHPLPASLACSQVEPLVIWIGMLVIVQDLPQTPVVCLVMSTGTKGRTIVLEYLPLKGESLVVPVAREGM